MPADSDARAGGPRTRDPSRGEPGAEPRSHGCAAPRETLEHLRAPKSLKGLPPGNERLRLALSLAGQSAGYGIHPSASQAGGRVPFICEPSFGGWRLTQMTTIVRTPRATSSKSLRRTPRAPRSLRAFSSVTSEPISPRHGNHPFPARDRPVAEYAGRHVAASQRPVGRTAGRAARSSRRRAHGRHLPSLRDETDLLALNPHPTGVRDSRSLGHVGVEVSSGSRDAIGRVRR